MPEEEFRIDCATVRIRPSALPHPSRLNAKDRQRAMIAGSLRDSQGVYVYRAKRLVICGGPGSASSNDQNLWMVLGEVTCTWRTFPGMI